MTTNQLTQNQGTTGNPFLDRLLIDPTLANSYLEISQQANGQENAPETLTTWLQQQGYDTTPELVYEALIALQNSSLAYWTGIYGQSFFESSQPTPVLVICPNAEGDAVPYLNGIELKNYVFESVETDDIFYPTLSWNLESNQTAGNITFYYTSGVAFDSNFPTTPNRLTDYTGNWFQGRLQTSTHSSAQNYYGAIGQPSDIKTIPQFVLAGEEEKSWWDKNSTYVYVGIGAVAIVVIIGVCVYRKRRVPETDFDKATKEQKKSERKFTDQELEKISNYTGFSPELINTLAKDKAWQSMFREGLQEGYFVKPQDHYFSTHPNATEEDFDEWQAKYYDQHLTNYLKWSNKQYLKLVNDDKYSQLIKEDRTQQRDKRDQENKVSTDNVQHLSKPTDAQRVKPSILNPNVQPEKHIDLRQQPVVSTNQPPELTDKTIPKSSEVNQKELKTETEKPKEAVNSHEAKPHEGHIK